MAGYQFFIFIAGPLIKANTSAPDRPKAEPNTLAIPGTLLMEMVSILNNTAMMNVIAGIVLVVAAANVAEV
uniref:Uncharacterized protein n=1 Tax=Rhizophora mucronata TaxID=61149 RepID=A0A2P2N636_RHIMU